MAATAVACACIVLLHRLAAYAATLSPYIDRILNGEIRILASRGRIDADELRRGLVTLPEVQHAIRMRTRTDALAARYTVVLERNGDITVVDVDLTEEGNAK